MTPPTIGFTSSAVQHFRAIREREQARAAAPVAKPQPTQVTETIVAELHDRVDRFVEVKPLDAAAGRSIGEVDDAMTAVMRDAVLVLTQLGEPRTTATQLVERAAAADRTIDTADELIAAAFRLKDAPT